MDPIAPVGTAGTAGLDVRDEGAGAPVLFLHGWALDLEQYAPQAEALRDAFRVLRIDRPGFGRSPGVPGAEADVAAIEAVLAGRGLARVALVASSQAGRAALRYAHRRPEAVAALVLDGAPLEGFLPGPRPADVAPLGQLMHLLATEGVEAVRRQLRSAPFFALHRGVPGASERLAAMLDRYPANDLRAGGAAPGAGAPNLAAELHAIDVPTLVVNGEFDTAHRRLTGEALAYGLPRAERLVLRGAGHVANLDAADEYTVALRRFLGAHAP